MNFVVIGLGSMGKRRIRLLKKYFSDNRLPSKEWRIIGVDKKNDRRQEVNKLFSINCYKSLDDALKNNDISSAIISTSPLSHSSIVSECLSKELHVFTEINLVDDGYNYNIDLAKTKNKVLFLSSTPMYRKEMQYVKNIVLNGNHIFTYRYHIGQYLPEWHPWENYKDFFVGDKRTNGCREIMAIELPWMVEVFGEIEDISSYHSKITDLNIDYDDTYQIIIKHESGIMGQLSVDVSTPKSERHFELWTEKYYLDWKGTADSLFVLNPVTNIMEQIELYDDVSHEEGYSSFIVENAYYDELREFIECVLHKGNPRYTYEKDKKVLDWIDEIEK